MLEENKQEEIPADAKVLEEVEYTETNWLLWPITKDHGRVPVSARRTKVIEDTTKARRPI